MTDLQRIGCVGGGAWGTTLALVARRAGRDAVLWARAPKVVAAINRRHRNAAYLPRIALDPAIRATGDLADVAAADLLLLATPAQALRGIAERLAPHVAPGMPAVICAKGIERGSATLMSTVVAEALPQATVAVLSGPSFAGEVARELPTAVTLACADTALAARIVAALATARFRIYQSDDVVGAEVGGAVKNVLAIACGITIGRKLGENARAALLTRGLAEVVRLGTALGGKAETMMGLSGFGDLSLTCNSAQSRNTSLGIALGQGESAAAVLARRRSVTEGATTAEAVVALARRHGVEMPICEAVDRVLNAGADIDATIGGLLARPAGEETR
jgi:glycerol-3-phosphate dehydrogenase (NAD(P)+)